MNCAALPVAGRVTSPYGWRWLNGRSDLHTGVDIGAPEGTPVYAMLPGVAVVVAPTGRLSGYGNAVVLQHAPELFTLYAHLARLQVAQGAHVAGGEQIGTVGRTAGTREDPGRVFAQSGAHLHMEFLRAWPPAGRDLDRLDPAPILAELGIVVPPSGPLQLACGARPSSPTHAEGPTLPRPSSSSSGNGLGLLLAAFIVSRYTAGHAGRSGR